MRTAKAANPSEGSRPSSCVAPPPSHTRICVLFLTQNIVHSIIAFWPRRPTLLGHWGGLQEHTRKEHGTVEIELTLKLGDSAVAKVRGESQREIIQMAAFFSELPTVCPVCQARVQFTSRHPQGYDYYGMRCAGKPSHETTFGAHREGGTLYYKANEPWTAWEPASRPDDAAADPKTYDVDPPAPARAGNGARPAPRREARPHGR